MTMNYVSPSHATVPTVERIVEPIDVNVGSVTHLVIACTASVSTDQNEGRVYQMKAVSTESNSAGLVLRSRTNLNTNQSKTKTNVKDEKKLSPNIVRCGVTWLSFRGPFRGPLMRTVVRSEVRGKVFPAPLPLLPYPPPPPPSLRANKKNLRQQGGD